jgi:hypothetical protein
MKHRKKVDGLISLVSCFFLAAGLNLLHAQEEKPLRIIAFGAHPDDPEFQMGGTAIKYAKLGHKVLLVACTNGDIGHWEMSGSCEAHGNGSRGSRYS